MRKKRNLTEDVEEPDEELDEEFDEEKKEHFPTSGDIRKELDREHYRNRFRMVLRSTLFTMLIGIAAAVIIAVIVMPVMQIVGSSMSPTLNDGDTVLAINGSGYKQGDVLAFYYNNNILVKRVVAVGGDEVVIDDDGNVFINGEYLDEPYVETKALGQCNLEFPFVVPEGLLFVMGDNRELSVDSRHTAVGCINPETVVGRIVVRVWPLKEMRLILK